MLVAASMLLYGDPVTGLQFFGYSIALGGMIYYKLGYDAIKSYAGDANRQWAEFGTTRPVTRKLIIFGSVILFTVSVIYGAAPGQASEYLNAAASKVGVKSA